MNFALPDFMPAAAEIFLLSMTGAVLLADLFFGHIKNHRITYVLTQLTLIGAAVITLLLFSNTTQITFSNAFIADPLASLLKLFIYLTSFFTFTYSRLYVGERNMPQGEYYVLGLFAVLGMMVLVSAHSFLTLFLGLELLSLPLYAMVAMRRDSPTAAEGAMKYFVTGSLASGMLLYGISMLYGATKTLDITVAAHVIAMTPPHQNLIMIFGLVGEGS